MVAYSILPLEQSLPMTTMAVTFLMIALAKRYLIAVTVEKLLLKRWMMVLLEAVEVFV